MNEVSTPQGVALAKGRAGPPQGDVALAKGRGDRRRFAVVYVLPLVLLLAWIALPLARGTETLYMRDVLNAHLAMKWSQARALRQGYFPLLDPYRGGGQPLAGNPNAVPFYPTNALYLWGSPFWALNAHFWIHLLLAPFAFFWMARRWGLAREPAWAAATCYAVSGFYLSHLSFYNLIAGATLAPALVAACLGFAEAGAPVAEEAAWRGGRPGVPRRALYAPAIAALWGLLLVSGDPLMAAMAGCLAAAAMLMSWKRWAWRGLPAGAAAAADAAPLPAPAGPMAAAAALPAPVAPAPAAPALARRRRFQPAWGALAMLGAAFACGTLIAMPQIVEFLRILPVSFRGFRGYTGGVATIASWDPRQAVEWLLPMIFGRLDVRGGGNFWAQRFFTGAPPLYPSFYPGALALALIAAAGGARCRASWWARGAVAAGLFCSLGRFNPVMSWLIARLGGGALRYPVKFWLPVAIGAALLCGLGFERLLAGPPAAATAGGAAGAAGAADAAVAASAAGARRRFRRTLGALALAYGSLWAFLTLLPGPATKLLRLLIPAERPLAFVANERLRWAGLCLFSLLIVGALALLARRLKRSPRAAWTAGGLLLAAHAAAQVMLLQPLYPTDAVTPYRVPPPAISYLPQGSTIVNPEFEHLFGPSGLTAGNFPSPELKWLERRAFYEMFPFTGPLWDRRYELDESPEGLDTYLTRMVQGSLKDATDAERLRLLAAWGVGRLVIERALAPLPANARLLAELPSFGQRLHVYEVMGRTPEVFLARRIWLAPQMNGAYRTMKSSAFDPRWDVVVPGSGPPRSSAGGTVRMLRQGPESLLMDLDVGSTGSLLVVQRALLIYRATIDGRLTPLIVANLHRSGLLVPAGRHQVRMWVDRTNFHRSLVVAGFGLACLPALAAWGAWGRLGWRRRRRAAGTPEVAGAAPGTGC